MCESAQSFLDLREKIIREFVAIFNSFLIICLKQILLKSFYPDSHREREKTIREFAAKKN